MKKTKIVCTIGPASESQDILRELFLNGLNVCRLNFSHGSHEEHKRRIDNIKMVREELNMPIGIMLDTKGPEIRLGDFKNGTIEIEEGDILTLTTRDILGDKSIVSISYDGLPYDVEKGSRILIDDGLVEFRVLDIIDNTDIKCIALNNGTLKNHKGVNVPNVKINLPSITKKDVDDILFGIENGIDFIAASFVRKASDVLEIRKILEENNGDFIEIISKIENQEGVDNIDEILAASDGIMVARGDLGVEIQTEEIPLVQKELIKKSNLVGKPVITATQMLDSMMRNPRPTRAEVTDVANAILDGSSAIMLSGETAAGKYPVESVKTMYNIAIRTEESLNYSEILSSKVAITEVSTTNAIGKATCTTAMDLGASAIITATSSGYTSKAISKFRPKSPIIAATTTESVMRRLSLVWGVYPVLSPYSNSTDDVIEFSIQSAVNESYVKEGDLVVITAGIPVGTSGSTNLIKVHTIGKTLLKGMGIGKDSTLGRVCIADTEEELIAKFKDGDVIVSKDTHREMVSFMERASAIITEQGGLTSHAAIVGLNLNKPTIVGAEDATTILQDGEIITVDSTTGLVYKGEARVL
ncbi:pyruvate kinase [Tissierella praeacuta]|uniref:Pyruvate kinase n=1 Tax=Tissierella praeacuta DSM 18095 TaxID=1123404 RepID=A0A1M4UZS7_9FIRM|nr:pyruvate kinase [Tissierella praeacuta]MBU5255150.1 pyruvate kinase [Tissierella praeacuta]TCU74004.1 pyruvate kinase [Tissierella praeacuta]SHE62143.1 pyruvate kinase [Tissierella praeacuta DSM 18095]SUP02732.1 Pyruvate kinase [Tissierella praeacuta]